MEYLEDSSRPVDETLGDKEQRELFRRILGQFSETLEGREKTIFSRTTDIRIPPHVEGNR